MSNAAVVFFSLSAVFGASSLYFAIKRAIYKTRCSEYETFTRLVKSVVYYEPWNEVVSEWVKESVQDGFEDDGTPRMKETYIQKERVVEHEAEYYAELDTGDQVSVISSVFEEGVDRFGYHGFRYDDIARNYYDRVGGKETYMWDGDMDTCLTISMFGKYYNPVRASVSMFNNAHVSEDEAVSLGLYKRKPKSVFHDNVYGRVFADSVLRSLEYHNMELTRINGMRLVYVFFGGKDAGIACKQRDYWLNGARNELTVCVGVDGSEVKWCRCFSWSHDKTLEAMIENMVQKSGSADDILKWTDMVVDKAKLWKPNDLSEYDYLKHDGDFDSGLIAITLFGLSALSLLTGLLFLSYR